MVIKSKTASKFQVSARDVHVIWLLTKSGREFPKKNLQEIATAQFTFASKNDIADLIEKAVFLELLEETEKGWKTTSKGQEFAKLEHWRYWQPKGGTLHKVRSLSLEHVFFAIPLSERPIVIDLFSGVGGLSLGFEAAGFNVGLSIDNDPEACAAHRQNFPHGVVKQEGVEKIAADPKGYLSKIPELKGRKIAGIVGGPPCQGFSNIGERNVSDERNLLTSRFMDVVLGLEPDFFLMENVPGLATSGIPPKVSVHLGRLAKAIGEPAAAIAALLPKAPNSLAKRDRQYRKRLVSAVVTDFKAKLAKKKFEGAPSVTTISATAYCFDLLLKTLAAKVGEVYGEMLEKIEIRKIMEKVEPAVAELAMSSAVELLLKREVVKESDCEEALKAIGNGKGLDPLVKKAARKVLDDYSAPYETKMIGGKKVGPILQHLIERASEKYDIVDPTVFNAAQFGAPQSRSRLFLLGVHKKLKRKLSLPKVTHALKENKGSSEKLSAVETVYNAISDLPDIDRYESLIDGHELPSSDLQRKPVSSFSRHMRLDDIPAWDASLPRASWNPFVVDCCNRTLHAKHVVERLKNTLQGVQDETSHKTRLHPDRPSCTLRAGTREAKGSHTAVRPVHYEYHRVISVREGARLMGYPDWMTFHRTKWHGFRLVGNGVPFHLAHAMAAQVFGAIYAHRLTGIEDRRVKASRAA